MQGGVVMVRKQVKNKLKQGYGTGCGKDYIPFIQTREFNSSGTISHLICPLNGRSMELLSQGELEFTYLLLWNPDVVDIREQFPLDLKETIPLCQRLGIRHPYNEETPMTTDFLVTYRDGSEKAFSIKSSRKDCESKRTKEILLIEELAWCAKGIEWEIVYKEDFNPIEVQNIRLIMEYADPRKIHTPMSLVKHLLATHQISFELTKEPLNFYELSKELSIDDIQNYLQKERFKKGGTSNGNTI